jgi:Flp pilus assembly pilin Flp
MRQTLVRFIADDEGSALTEYGLLAAALALPMMAALGLIAVTAGKTLLTTGNGLSQIGIHP